MITAGAMAGAGATAGLIAGLVMIAAAMLLTALTGHGLWLPAKLVAALYYGASAVDVGAGATMILVGVLTHLAASAVFGIIFAFLTRGRLDTGAAVIAGIVYGLVIWLAMTYLVLPWTVPTLHERIQSAVGWFAVLHLLYGMTLAVSPGLVRSFHRRNVQTERLRTSTPVVP